MLNLKIFALLILEVEFKVVSNILIIYRVRAVFWLPMTPGAQLLHLGDYKILVLSYTDRFKNVFSNRIIFRYDM